MNEKRIIAQAIVPSNMWRRKGGAVTVARETKTMWVPARTESVVGFDEATNSSGHFSASEARGKGIVLEMLERLTPKEAEELYGETLRGAKRASAVYGTSEVRRLVNRGDRTTPTPLNKEAFQSDSERERLEEIRQQRLEDEQWRRVVLKGKINKRTRVPRRAQIFSRFHKD
ncbi:hypothetical protein ACFL2C_02130 [Patescibacteria group bacterium]